MSARVILHPSSEALLRRNPDIAALLNLRQYVESAHALNREFRRTAAVHNQLYRTVQRAKRPIIKGETA